MNQGWGYLVGAVSAGVLVIGFLFTIYARVENNATKIQYQERQQDTQRYRDESQK